MATQQVVSTTDAAKELGDISPQRVRALLKEGRIVGAVKISGVWVIPTPVHVLTARQGQNRRNG